MTSWARWPSCFNSYLAQGHRPISPLRHSTGMSVLESSHWKLMLSPSTAAWFFSACVKMAGSAANAKSGIRCKRLKIFQTRPEGNSSNKHYSTPIGDNKMYFFRFVFIVRCGSIRTSQTRDKCGNAVQRWIRIMEKFKQLFFSYH